MALKEETGMTDEAIEGWALMISRDPRRMRRLEAKYSNFSGAQRELAPTSWRAESGASGTEDSDGGRGGRGGFRGHGGRGRNGRGRGGNVAGPSGDKDTEVARHRKEANKGSRANHNRRDQRARKMARGGGMAG
jgi:activating signal cointegrator complex subunit 2